MRLLLDTGADVHAQGGEYGSALQAAAGDGNVDAMRLLLDRGADVNAQGGYYGTALQSAAFYGQVEAMKFLLDKGADIHAQGGRYGTALLAALVPTVYPVRCDLKDPFEMAEVLLDHGADITADIPDSKYGNALSAVKQLWRHDEVYLARFMKLLELKGWMGGRSGTNENGVAAGPAEYRSANCISTDGTDWIDVAMLGADLLGSDSLDDDLPDLLGADFANEGTAERAILAV